MATMPVKFSSSHVCVTASVGSKFYDCAAFRLWVTDCINRHFSGDYGDIPEDEIRINNESLQDKDQIMSVYRNGSETIWIITDPGHEVTTVLFPSEY
jgi:hypothetical protein